MSWIQSDLQYTPPEPYVPPTWSDGTDEEIVTALQKHYDGEINLTEYWSVGDERVVSLSAMSAYIVDGIEIHPAETAQDITLVLSEVGGMYLSDGVTTCAFQVDQKDCLSDTGLMGSSKYTIDGGWPECERRTWCNTIYKNAFPVTLQPIFKEFIHQDGTGYYGRIVDTTDTFALRAEIEVSGVVTRSKPGEGTQVEWYKTAANRIKQPSNNGWWERSRVNNYSDMYCMVYNGNDYSANGYSSYYGIVPFGVI